MYEFVFLCLLSRLGYSLNDLLTGRLARRYDGMEVAALRGISLGLTMAPLLFWVPSSTWCRLLKLGPELLLTCVGTAASNVLQLQAARHLPFGLRAALIVGGVVAGSLALGWFASDEPVVPADAVLGAVIVASALFASRGSHASHEIVPEIGRGALLSLASAALAALVSWQVQKLARGTHPFLAAWAWEGGSGFVLLVPMVLLRRSTRLLERRRLAEVGVASLPTVVGSGASVLALTRGQLGLWGAFAGAQILFTVALGVALHDEKLGGRRALCFGVAALAIVFLAFNRVAGQ